jgi:hypothetical protein
MTDHSPPVRRTRGREAHMMTSWTGITDNVWFAFVSRQPGAVQGTPPGEAVLVTS